ncbi:unnamed protein product [Schistocephalus solidus]|uniref:Na_H_Exchanger domain-containing protein n=1 Tax=Schistocephalus solidus TaxID=70667 RepID=A0A183TR10_SCHSO|nr:unnamed protein product [Schistocephalus solidus]
MGSDSPCNINELEEIARITGKRIENEHRLDNLYMLTYTILLALSVLTIWLFKHRRFRYVHETGLSVIYGLIVGAIFRFGVEERTFTTTVYNLPPQSNSCSIRLPPEKAILHLAIYAETNVSRYYHYSLTGESQRKESSHYRMTFNPEIFFNVILPPIIFSAGYSMKRKHFFKNFGAITMFALLGTLISAVAIAIICYGLSRLAPSLSESLTFSDCIYFGSIISATDPVTVLAIFNDLHVDVDLYALVFGESVLNDAVAITMSQSVDKYGSYKGSYSGAALLSSIGDFAATFAGSFALGISVGCFTALLTKYTHIRDYPLLETVLFVLLSYSTFFLSEAVGFTGIVALLFCGVTQAHYTYNNLSQESQVWTKQFFELLNFLSENFVFAYIGVSTFSFRSHYWNVAFIFIAIFACALSRLFCGLRGAMAFSLAIRNTSTTVRQMFFSTTIVIVMITVFVGGCLSLSMLQWLKIQQVLISPPFMPFKHLGNFCQIPFCTLSGEITE